MKLVYKLDTDEEIIFEARSHWTTLGIPYIATIIFSLTSMAYPLFSLLTIISVLVLVYRIATKANTTLLLTNKRLIGATGLINTKYLDTKLCRLNTITVDETITGEFFRCGSILVRTANESYYFANILDAHKKKQCIFNEIDKHRSLKPKTKASLNVEEVI